MEISAGVSEDLSRIQFRSSAELPQSEKEGPVALGAMHPPQRSAGAKSQAGAVGLVAHVPWQDYLPDQQVVSSV